MNKVAPAGYQVNPAWVTGGAKPEDMWVKADKVTNAFNINALKIDDADKALLENVPEDVIGVMLNMAPPPTAYSASFVPMAIWALPLVSAHECSPRQRPEKVSCVASSHPPCHCALPRTHRILSASSE